MKNMVDIDVIIDEKYNDPKVTIQTKARTRQVENIITAVETVSENDYPTLAGYNDDRIEFLSQRDIVRAFTEGRKIVIQTDAGQYYSNKTMSGVEDILNPDRFIRISQSEIINLYKVKRFDVNLAGTIGVEFDCGIKSWASRSRVKQIKEFLTQKLCEWGDGRLITS